jgi:hypothetical protein
LPDPVAPFAAMGHVLRRGGKLVIKDIDFGTLRFHTIDPALQARVFRAREQWEGERVDNGYAFEDSWVGSKLAGYLRQAGYEEVQERSYRIVRHYPLHKDFRFYLQGIGSWFVCEDMPHLEEVERQRWLELFQDGAYCALDQQDFVSEETEYVVTGIWRGHPTPEKRYFEVGTELPVFV